MKKATTAYFHPAFVIGGAHDDDLRNRSGTTTANLDAPRGRGQAPGTVRTETNVATRRGISEKPGRPGADFGSVRATCKHAGQVGRAQGNLRCGEGAELKTASTTWPSGSGTRELLGSPRRNRPTARKSRASVSGPPRRRRAEERRRAAYNACYKLFKEGQYVTARESS